MKSILDPTFKYTSSIDTDIRKTFARVRREHRLREQRIREAYNRAADVKLNQPHAPILRRV